MKRLAVCLILCVAVALANEEGKRLVYGEDDRTEPYTITDTNLRTLIQADVALIPSDYFSQNSNGSWSLHSYRFYFQGECSPYSDSLCSDEPFRGQITAPFCSGFLVNKNQIVTAGHCLDSFAPEDVYVVFDFYQRGPSTRPEMDSISPDNLYKSAYFDYVLVASEDWGIITLDREVVGRTPLKYRTSGTPEVGAPLVLVGHPWGLPMKVAPGAEIKDYPSDTNFFSANTDSYQGNSGSMVVNANTWEVEGILVNGNSDYAWDSANKCCRSHVCSDATGCSGNFEGITKITVPPLSSSSSVQPVLLLAALLALLVF